MVTETLTQYELEQQYDEMLDDCYEPYKMADMIYYASDILKNCDPMAYRTGMSDYANALIEDGQPVEGY